MPTPRHPKTFSWASKSSANGASSDNRRSDLVSTAHLTSKIDVKVKQKRSTLFYSFSKTNKALLAAVATKKTKQKLVISHKERGYVQQRRWHQMSRHPCLQIVRSLVHSIQGVPQQRGVLQNLLNLFLGNGLLLSNNCRVIKDSKPPQTLRNTHHLSAVYSWEKRKGIVIQHIDSKYRKVSHVSNMFKPFKNLEVEPDHLA